MSTTGALLVVLTISISADQQVGLPKLNGNAFQTKDEGPPKIFTKEKDAAPKTVGPFWRGFGAFYGRCAPHAMIILLSREQIMKAYDKTLGEEVKSF